MLIFREQISKLTTKLEEKYSHRNYAHGIMYLSIAYPEDVGFHGFGQKEQCVRYFNHYAWKSACFRDIASAVALLPKDIHLEFLRDIEMDLDNSVVKSITNIAN